MTRQMAFSAEPFDKQRLRIVRMMLLGFQRTAFCARLRLELPSTLIDVGVTATVHFQALRWRQGVILSPLPHLHRMAGVAVTLFRRVSA
jgi:hypothetical protein